ncbi:MAG TPA: chemotaxis protein CheW, partial [Fibrobacteria bacterium]|nr:chemotaxis protein CheW [Fibrobacteria bacterium]
VVNVGGVLAPVVDMRRLLGLPPREPRLSDRLIFIETAHRPLLLPVDSVAGLVPWDRARTRSPDLLRGRSAVLGLMETGDGLLVIQNVEALLEDKEGPAVDLALAHASAPVEGEG